MARWRKRGRGSSKNEGIAAIVFLGVIAFAFLAKYWAIILVVACVVLVVAVAVKLLNDKQKGSTGKQNTGGYKKPSNYSAKDSIMTDCEKTFFEAFKEIAGPQYTVQPQINLASVIDKESYSKYRNELFRNIDFGIFDSSYSLVVLIEINDPSHLRQDRSARDSKVQAICADAGIPLVTFWTKYGVNKAYIRERLANYLPLIANPADTKDDDTAPV